MYCLICQFLSCLAQRLFFSAVNKILSSFSVKDYKFRVVRHFRQLTAVMPGKMRGAAEVKTLG